MLQAQAGFLRLQMISEGPHTKAVHNKAEFRRIAEFGYG